MNFVSTDNPTVRDAYERIKALRQLTADMGVKTHKSQWAILEALDPQTLAAVALLLKTDKDNDNEKRNFRR